MTKNERKDSNTVSEDKGYKGKIQLRCPICSRTKSVNIRKRDRCVNCNVFLLDERELKSHLETQAKARGRK